MQSIQSSSFQSDKSLLPDDGGEIIKGGFLLKRTDRFRSWAPRYIVLKANILLYYISKDQDFLDDKFNSKGKGKEFYDMIYTKDASRNRLQDTSNAKRKWFSLKLCVVRCGVQCRTGYPFSLYVEHSKTQQKMFLAARSEDERIEWIQALLTAIGESVITPLPCSNFKRSEDSSPDLLFTLQCLANSPPVMGSNGKKRPTNQHLASLNRILQKNGRGSPGIGLRGSLVALLRPTPPPSASLSSPVLGVDALNAYIEDMVEAMMMLLHWGADVNEVFTDDMARPWDAKRPPLHYALMERVLEFFSDPSAVPATSPLDRSWRATRAGISSPGVGTPDPRAKGKAKDKGKGKGKEDLDRGSEKEKGSPLWHCVFYLTLHGANPTYFNLTTSSQVVPAGNLLHDVARLHYLQGRDLPFAMVESVKLAVRVGLDTNLENARGMSPLHAALRKGSETLALLLIEQCRAKVTDLKEMTVKHRTQSAVQPLPSSPPVSPAAPTATPTPPLVLRQDTVPLPNVAPNTQPPSSDERPLQDIQPPTKANEHGPPTKAPPSPPQEATLEVKQPEPQVPQQEASAMADPEKRGEGAPRNTQNARSSSRPRKLRTQAHHSTRYHTSETLLRTRGSRERRGQDAGGIGRSRSMEGLHQSTRHRHRRHARDTSHTGDEDEHQAKPDTTKSLRNRTLRDNSVGIMNDFIEHKDKTRKHSVMRDEALAWDVSDTSPRHTDRIPNEPTEPTRTTQTTPVPAPTPDLEAITTTTTTTPTTPPLSPSIGSLPLLHVNPTLPPHHAQDDAQLPLYSPGLQRNRAPSGLQELLGEKDAIWNTIWVLGSSESVLTSGRERSPSTSSDGSRTGSIGTHRTELTPRPPPPKAGPSTPKPSAGSRSPISKDPNVEVVTKLGNRIGRGTLLEGGSLLHSATVGTCFEVMERLLQGEWGGRAAWTAEINGTDSKGCTPLAYAVMQQQRESVKFLVRHQADVLTVNHRGQNLVSQFILGAQFPQREFCEWLVDEISTSPETREWLINGQDQNGNTPMHLLLLVDMGTGITNQNITREIKMDILQCLLGMGAKLDVLNHSFYTPIDFAKRSNEKGIIDLLDQHLRGRRGEGKQIDMRIM
eukprot:TRINITY_DN5513_c0_g1_i4.p1 TRINITY_DN5513_c0_g1~~TRINITY_DN5513_c0_g1_i4.p1  ORF type:complete len:1108 (+),score=192.49 TRINITY_DN5513_c0_g1_i4:171-3494(+)